MNPSATTDDTKPETKPATKLAAKPGSNLNNMMLLRDRLARQTTAETRFDAATRAAYASEASNYRQVPIGVVIPRTVDDFVTTVRLCNEYDVPIVPRGAGTSMCGQSVNAAIVIDHSKYLNQVISVDAARRVATVQPGVICDQLKAAAAKEGLTFGPDPATHTRCTLGGMIGNNSCGAHSVMAGKTVENIEQLEILTADGERFWVGPTDDATFAEHVQAGGRRAQIVTGLKALATQHADAIRQGFPTIKRRVSGYNLDQLLPENGFNIARALVGSEGTCVNVLHAKTRLITNPTHRLLVVLGFENIFEAADSVPQLLPLEPIAMEGLDYGIIGGLKRLGLRLDDIAELPAGNAWLMVEFGATSDEEVRVRAGRLVAATPELVGRPSMRLVEGALMQRLWSIRETGASATSRSEDPDRPDPVVGWEDAAVEPAKLGSYLREFAALVERYGYRTNLYGHFGDGCIHARITFDLSSQLGLNDWRKFLEEAAKLVVKYGGSLSGEHGDGQAKGEFLHLMYTPELMQAFRDFKALWDPKGLLNPGKLIDAMPVDANLRLGPDYVRREAQTTFAFGSDAPAGARADKHADGTAFAREIERCVGMGKCRSLEGGTMCPSFKATREELYSPRGRARLFFEMLRGEVLLEGRDDDAMKDSLDMCLACKGCKGDCPTHVDIPKYRSEFLSRYYRTHRRSLMDFSIAKLGDWLPLATRLSGPVNFLMGNRYARKAAKWFGLAPEVKFPLIASQTFRASPVAKRLIGHWPEQFDAGHVVVWTDTFNNGFSPAILEAAVRVVEASGRKAVVTRRHVCCGRPLYDSGLLSEARQNLLEILDILAPALAVDVPILVLEPSCLSVFRDELPSILPQDERATLLAKRVITIAEFAKSVNMAIPQADEVQVHAHCHQKACGGTAAEKALGANVLDTGCCGMAGAFGYHEKTAAVGARVGEIELMPALARVAPSDTLVADGFSCRSQIKNLDGRRAQHLAEVLAAQLER